MHIRPVLKTDAEEILGIYGPYIENTTFTFETVVPSLHQFKQRIIQYTQNYPWLVAEEDGRIIGYAYAGKHRERDAYQWCVESSVYLAPAYQSKGIGGELYNALFSILTESGFVNVYAGITLPNPRSYNFHSRMGFEEVGTYRKIGYKLGKWHDVIWMAKQINAYINDPAPPTRPL